jgi:hypothetical protein
VVPKDVGLHLNESVMGSSFNKSAPIYKGGEALTHVDDRARSDPFSD